MSLEHGELLAGYFKPDALDSAQLAKLDSNALWAWIILCLQANPRCGIFEPNLQLWAMRSRVPADDLPRCLDLYAARGWIERDGDYIWLINYTKIQGKQQQWLDAARREVLELQSCTPLAERWLQYYSDIKPISKQDRFTVQDSTGQLQNRTDSTSVGAIRAARAVGASAKAKAKELKPLAEIEAGIPDRWRQAWHGWKDGCLIPSNRSGSMAESRIAAVLDHLFWAQREYGLSDAAMSHGLLEATTRDKPNGNYVISCANSYTPPDMVAPPQERYYTGPPSPPVDTRNLVQIQAERLGWQIGKPVMVDGVSMGIFNGEEIVPE